jgi:non-canonical (house-cleaning) NTP pyrophosphatase
MRAFAWVGALERSVGKGRAGTFYLPRKVAELVREGKELGDADDLVFGRSNSKQQNGAIGILTGDVLDRAAFYEHAVIMALVPFKNPHLSFSPLTPA